MTGTATDTAQITDIEALRDLLIEKLKHQLAGLRRHRFGAGSESLDQLELTLEEEEIARAGEAPPSAGDPTPSEDKRKPKRRPLPDHLPRHEVVLSTGEACTSCGGSLRQLGEDVTEELEYVPGRFMVNRIVRPRMACSDCEQFTQAPLPSRPIERGHPGAGLLAHVLVSKYADHLPLYRQAQIFGRDGVELDRSTLADWVGASTALLEPLANSIGLHVRDGAAIFADDTPVKLQAPVKTRTARLWTYVRDERPWKGDGAPAAWYQISTDRKGERPRGHLKSFKGWMHADGYAGFEELYRIESNARGQPPDERIKIRQAEARPVFDDLETWLGGQLPKLSGKTPPAAAIRYGLTRLARLRPYLDDGRLELDNNAAERAMRPVALGRKNHLFMGSEGGGKSAAIAYTLIETAKLNGVDPQAWLTNVLGRIADHKTTQLDELMPWHCAQN